MAAPTLQAEAAAFTVVTTGACAPTIPTHTTDDILLATVMVWVPVTAGAISDIPTPTDWTKLGSVDLNGATKDGQIAWFWRRAPSSGTTVSFARGAGWDTGTDGAFGARVDVIRGCITTGDPYDAFAASTQYTTANQNTPAVTVSGAERLVMFFEAHCVDTTTAQFTARVNFTMGTHRGSTTGTGGGAQNARRETGSSEAATATTHAAPAAGRFYAIGGISFKPPAAATFERSAAIDGAGAIASAATFFSILTGTAALDAAGAVASSGVVIDGHNRSAAVDAAGGISTSGQVIKDRSASVSATAGIASAQQRDLLRSAAVDAAASATVAAFRRDLLRQAAVSATGNIASAATFFSIFQRSAALDGVASIVSAPQRDLLRQLALGATADINATGAIEGGFVTHNRSASLDAAAAIASQGIFWTTFERAVALDATGAISTAAIRVLLRASELAATGSISTSALRETARSAALSALAEISATPDATTEWTYGPYEGWTFNGIEGFAYAGGTAVTYDGGATWTYHGGD